MPCAESLSVNDLVLRVAGALGLAFMVKVTVSSSSWKNVSGVPDALILVTMEPLLAPEKSLANTAPPDDPAGVPDCATA